MKISVSPIDPKLQRTDRKFVFITEDVINISVENVIFTIPKGFDTDLYSIPKPFRYILYYVTFGVLEKYLSKYKIAAIVHDWLYDYDEGHSRKEADIIFYQLMKNRKAPFAWLFYKIVSWFGSSRWGPEKGDKKKTDYDW